MKKVFAVIVWMYFVGTVGAQSKKTSYLPKFAAVGCKSSSRNGQVLLVFQKPVDVFIEKQNNVLKMTVTDGSKKMKPLTNKL